MRQNTKILAAVAIVLLGGFAASTFFKKNGQSTRRRPKMPGNIQLEIPHSALQVPLRSDRSPAIVRSPAIESDRSAVSGSDTSEYARPGRLQSRITVPSMPDSYRTYLREPSGVPAQQDAPSTAGGVGRVSEKRRDSEPTAPRRHRIRDGDSLRRLAQTYLGQADRWIEIYRANRNVLTNPDVLPLNVDIVIPISQPSSSVSDSSNPLRSRQNSATRPGSITPAAKGRALVPLAPLAPIAPPTR